LLQFATWSAAMADPPVIKNAGQLELGQSLLSEAWIYIVIGLALGLVWVGVMRLLRSQGPRAPRRPPFAF
jgi:hypothetical protein